jgi:PAS domain S-box-containing protein
VRWIHSIAEYDAEQHRIVGTIQDVTDRKKLEEALRESELLFRTLADSGQALIWTSRVDKECDYFNQPWLEFTGRTLEQELGSGWVDGVHAEDRSRCIATYLSAFDRREPFSMSYRLRRADGEYRWIQDDGTPRYDTHGAFLGYIGHCLDITERIRDEERLRRIIDSSPLLIHEVSASGHYLMANQATCALLGISQEELTGKHFHELLPPDLAATFKERVDHVTMTREPLTVDDTLHFGGRERVFRSELFPVGRHDESLPRVIGMAYERTEEIRLHKEKDLLMKELNHRVKNSLAMVSSLVSLKESQSDADLSDIRGHIDTISLIYEKLSRIESVTEICLKDYLGTLLSAIVSFSARGVRVEQDIDEICVPAEQATSLGIIVNECATNAIKHGFPDTQVPVFAVKIKEDQKNNRYQMTISNTGRPFPKEIDVHNPQTGGLRLISTITAQSGGTMELQRAPHPVFTISFPAGT